ncbi:MAG: hypothetical protein ACHQUC_05440 [Chlamydiales bacterium]
MIQALTLAVRSLSSVRAYSTQYPMSGLYQPPLIGVKEADEISSQDIVDLATNKIGFLRIPHYVSQELSKGFCKKFFQHYRIQDYENAPGVGKASNLGMALFECTGNAAEKKRAEYYEQAARSMHAIRQLFNPHLSPLDKLRLEMECKWKHGASLLNLGEGRMFSGLIRCLNSDVLAHEDKLERDIPIPVGKINYLSQIALNFYLEMPEIGGEVRRWHYSLEDESYDTLRGASYGIVPERLDDRYDEVKPQQGDLILFNPRFLHSIKASKGLGNRITLSSFILYGGHDQPLQFWS